jgi:hypothetical protein
MGPGSGLLRRNESVGRHRGSFEAEEAAVAATDGESTTKADLWDTFAVRSSSGELLRRSSSSTLAAAAARAVDVRVRVG